MTADASRERVCLELAKEAWENDLNGWDEWARVLEEAFDAGRAEERRDVLPDLDLLRKLASGEGGRRTGDLMRRGWIRVEVTEGGHAALSNHTQAGGRDEENK